MIPFKLHLKNDKIIEMENRGCLERQRREVGIALKEQNEEYFLKKFILSIYLFIYLFVWLCWAFVAARGLFSGCGEWGLLFVAVRGLLIAVASFVVEHRL